MPAMPDRQYQELPYRLNERPHKYGPNVHLISDPFLLTRLARLCSVDCVQPEVNSLFRALYRSLGRDVANAELPRYRAKLPTRMSAKHPKEAIFEGELLATQTKVVIASLARAGILPSLELFEVYCNFLDPKRVRVDHIFINRSTDKHHHVTGAPIHGSKIGGTVDHSIVIIPDPMGATGNSTSNTVSYYKKEIEGKPSRWISMNLIVTPEYIRKLKADHPEVVIYAIRLDRGFSSKRALEALPGEFPDEERGLNDEQYIVPGGGGFGELSSNAWV
ncbi:MAG: uracil phosphoribosyltransferase [Pseudomonadota bacterium]